MLTSTYRNQTTRIKNAMAKKGIQALTKVSDQFSTPYTKLRSLGKYYLFENLPFADPCPYQPNWSWQYYYCGIKSRWSTKLLNFVNCPFSYAATFLLKAGIEMRRGVSSILVVPMRSSLTKKFKQTCRLICKLRKFSNISFSDYTTTCDMVFVLLEFLTPAYRQRLHDWKNAQNLTSLSLKTLHEEQDKLYAGGNRYASRDLV